MSRGSIYTLVDRPTGMVMCHGQCTDPENLDSPTWRVIVGVAHDDGWVDEEGVHHPMPERPSEFHNFCLTTKTWSDPRTATEVIASQWSAVRRDRDSRIDASDWVRSRADDLGEQVPQAWLDYRQALRDITLQADPFSIVWPVPPTN